MTHLINDLALLPAPSLLVLDDYQVLSDSRIHDALTFLLDHLPPQLHVIITTRIDPPLPLARWRAHGMLTELRAADLRFTLEEAAAFLTQLMQLPLSVVDIQALEQRTEGWIAGLQFAALAMRDRSDLANFVSTFTGSHRFVLDYLVDEVLLRQPPHLQSFLLQTAILDRMCSPLCDAIVLGNAPDTSTVFGNDSAEPSYSQALLEEFDRPNLFLVPLDDARHWYRYHHLFADVLRHRLHGGASSGKIQLLHLRAARWYEQHGFFAEAFQHCLQAADHEGCARLVEQKAQQLIGHGEIGLLQQCLAQLPPELIRTRPRLSIVAAWALNFTPDIDAMAARLDDAERLLASDILTEASGDMRHELAGELHALRGYVALRRQEIPAAIALLQQAQAFSPAGNALLLGFIVLHLGHAHRLNRNLVAASHAYSQAYHTGSATRDQLAAQAPDRRPPVVRLLCARVRIDVAVCRAAGLCTQPGQRPAAL
jgi:LuxR family maltose regulon positive regulatory protein